MSAQPSPEAIAAAIAAAMPKTTSIEAIMQRGEQPMGTPDWDLLNATPVPQPMHGGWLGHVVPGIAFLSLGFWWLLGIVRAYASLPGPFVARAWYPVFLSSEGGGTGGASATASPKQQRRSSSLLSSLLSCCCCCFPSSSARGNNRRRFLLPLEPCLILFSCFIGINGELWFGHDSFRTLHRGDGYLFVTHLAEWQHVVMYLAFAFSAIVSLVEHVVANSSSSSSSSSRQQQQQQQGRRGGGNRKTPLLPPRAPKFALAGAFALEFALFAFHLEGTALDIRAHKLLVVTIGCCAALSIVEALSPEDSPFAVEVAAAKSLATWVQGCWFVALAKILFEGRRSMDPRYHGSVMFLPAILGLVALGSGCLWVAAFLVGGAVFGGCGNGGVGVGGGGGAAGAATTTSRAAVSSAFAPRRAYGRLDSNDVEEDDDGYDGGGIGAVDVAPKARLGGGGGAATLELSAV